MEMKKETFLGGCVLKGMIIKMGMYSKINPVASTFPQDRQNTRRL